MIDRGIYNHIKNAIAQGQSKEAIVSDLSKSGLTEVQIEETYQAVQRGDLPDVPPATAESFTPSVHHAQSGALANFFLLLILAIGIGYVVYYVVPTLNLDVFASRITTYPARCDKSTDTVSYSASTATPVTFQVDVDDQEVTEITYSNYKRVTNRGDVTETHPLQHCAVSAISDWKCTDGTAALGFTNGTFFDDATPPNTCFVSRAQWYHLRYPPFWSSIVQPK